MSKWSSLTSGPGRPILRALGAGFAGAAALTIAHEASRKLFARPPRMDLAGKQLVEKGLESIGLSAPSGLALHGAALAGDLVTNSAYYGLAALGSPGRKWARGLWLGIGAGLEAIVVTPLLGLGRRPRGLTLGTQGLTLGCYALGGLVAGLTADAWDRRLEQHDLGQALRAIDRAGDIVVVQDGSGTIEIPLGV